MEPTDHLAAIADAAADLRADAEVVGPDAPVVTCPGWTAFDLVAHQGGVHRWAAAIVSGARTENLPDEAIDALMAGPADRADWLEWFADGAAALIAALESAPADLVALRFLKNAPEARRFWARRQAHETTIHAVDALATRLGHLPTAAQADIDPELAVDGIDELVTGFVPRRSSQLRTRTPLRVAVAPTDVSVGWTLDLSPDPPVTRDGADPDADALMTGTAAGLYLGLWNRGDEIAVDGEPEFLGVWRDLVRIQW